MVDFINLSIIVCYLCRVFVDWNVRWFCDVLVEVEGVGGVFVYIEEYGEEFGE